nr:hypothetical protein [Neorhizobium tomejilense]
MTKSPDSAPASALRIKRINAGRYRYGPYEIINSRRGVWELWIDGGGKPRDGSIVDNYPTYAAAKAAAIDDDGAAIEMMGKT